MTAGSTGTEPTMPKASRPDEEDPVSFAVLMDALMSGSEDAAWRIAELYTPHLLRAVRRSLPQAIRSKVDSVDIVNTLWASLLTKRRRLNGIREPAQLVALLTVVARNRVVDEHRKYTEVEARDIRREVGPYDETPAKRGDKLTPAMRRRSRDTTPSEVAMVREKWNLFNETLSVRDRAVIKGRVSGLSYDQIAAAIDGVSSRTARRIVADAVKQFA